MSQRPQSRTHCLHACFARSLALLFGLACGSLQRAPGAPAQGFQVAPPPARSSTLEGGVRLVTLDRPELSRSAQVEGLLRFDAGALHAPLGRLGLVEVLCGAWLEGDAEGLTSAELRAWLSAHQAELEVRARPQSIEVAWRVPAADLEGLLERLTAFAAAPHFEASALERARAALLARLEKAPADVPTQLARRADRTLERLVLGEDSPWARRVRVPDVRALTREHLLEFAQQHFVRAALTVGVAGGAEARDCGASVARATAALPTGAASEPLAAPACSGGELPRREGLLAPDGAEVELRVAIASPADPQAAGDLALWMAALAQRNGEDATLERARRVLRGLRFAPLDPTRHAGLSADPADALAPQALQRPVAWMAAARCDSARAAEGLDALRDCLRSGPPHPIVAESLASVARGDFAAPAAREALALAVRGAAGEFGGTAELASVIDAQGRLASVLEHVLPARVPYEVVVAPSSVLSTLGTAPSASTRERAPEGSGASGASDAPGASGAVASADAGDLRARLLETLGGESAWARVGVTAIAGEVTTRGIEGSVRVRILRDLDGRRMRMEQEIGGVASTVVVTPTAAWSRTPNRLFDLPEEQRARTQFRERRQLLSVLHDLAALPGMELRRREDGRVAVVDGGEVLCWMELSEDGKPRRLGYGEEGPDGAAYRYDDWQRSGALWWPAHVIEENGRSEFRWTSLELDAALPDGTFDRPSR